MSLPKTYKQAVFNEAGGSLVLEEVPIKMPSAGDILVKVEACGVCHSDLFSQYNAFGGGLPRVPGHEIIGTVAVVGDDVTGWKTGDRIGGGWHGGHDATCEKCKRGLFQFCEPYVINGVTKNGGYAEYCFIRAEAAVRIPVEVDAAKYAPMLCAGSTVLTAIRSAGLQSGDTVAVQGLGGLGHMAIQFSKKMGYRVIAISRGRDKEASVRALGAHEYIDATACDAGEALKKLGYAKLVVTTAMDTKAMTPLIKGIGIFGKLLVLSLPQPSDITINTNDMLLRGVSVQAWPVGSCHDCERTVEFAHQKGVECAVEVFPLEKAQDAYDAMLSGAVRYRAVITM
ncbi:alcohol dehydrogenase GroES-like domain-containing protein [Pleomassaria siparia CBS 279.74]|uniref:Alcohol dehydrogenase GroES-like domain-containing protein n=1 Tax=Pleomassaria siparia CBS 279.74 TaxID=1314801 RepID=A0A6G1K6G6_9PLEO|nr:alcohol dehydrogenase GroES-like domain-containing protein [Pleomassaria siparia CBS 279.74]